MLQIAQASVNDPRRPARRSRGKIMLLDQKRPFTAPGTLARNSDAVNSATDHNDLKPLTFQRRPSFRIDFHTPTEPLRTENWQLRTGFIARPPGAHLQCLYACRAPESASNAQCRSWPGCAVT